MTPDEQDAYYLLKLGESGRPEEQMAQFAASMFLAADMGADDILQFFRDVMERTRQLIYDMQSEIWTNLQVGGNQMPLIGAEEILHDLKEAYEAGAPALYLAMRNVLEDESEPFDPPTVQVVLTAKLESGRYLVVDVEPSIENRIGTLDLVSYKSLTNPDGDSVGIPDVVEVYEDEVNWYDIVALVNNAQERMYERDR